MADPNNPSVDVDQSLLDWRLKDVAAKERTAKAAEIMAATSEGRPATEGGVYYGFLVAVLNGRLVSSSDAAQVWADDLTKDYMAKFDLITGARKAIQPGNTVPPNPPTQPPVEQ